MATIAGREQTAWVAAGEHDGGDIVLRMERFRARVVQGVVALLTGLVIAGGGLVGSGGVAAWAQSGAACARADALLALDYVEAAERAYQRLLPRACAEQGLEQLQAAQKAQAAAGAAAAPGAAELKARRLQDAGYAAAAREAAQPIAESGQPFPADQRDATERLGWWQRALGWGGPPVRSVLEILALGLLGAALAVATLRWWRHWRERTVRVEPVVGNKADDYGQSLATVIADGIGRLKTEGPDRASPSLRVTRADEASFSIPSEVVEAFPQAALVGSITALGNWLFPPRRLRQLETTVHPAAPDRGVEATFTLSYTSRTKRDQTQSRTVSEREFGLDKVATDDLGARYQRLAVIGAIWAAYGLREGKEDAGLPESWKSYAHFALGSLFQVVGNTANAHRQYVAALDVDPTNARAHANLAALRLFPAGRAVVRSDTRTAAARLSSARRFLGGFPPLLVLPYDEAAAAEAPSAQAGADPDAMCFRIAYMEAARALYDNDLALEETGGGQAAPALAEQHVNAALRLLAAIDEEMRRSPSDGLRTFLEKLRLPVAIVVQSARVMAARPFTWVPAPAEGSGPDWLRGDALYNLACFHARRYGRPLGIHLADLGDLNALVAGQHARDVLAAEPARGETEAKVRAILETGRTDPVRAVRALLELIDTRRQADADRVITLLAQLSERGDSRFESAQYDLAFRSVRGLDAFAELYAPTGAEDAVAQDSASEAEVNQLVIAPGSTVIVQGVE